MSWEDDAPNIEMHLYGQTPVQAIGKIGTHPFYFRARHEHWRLEVYAPGVDLDGDKNWPEPVWTTMLRPWVVVPGPFQAGYMTHLQALKLIGGALRMWQRVNAVAVSPVTAPSSEGPA